MGSKIFRFLIKFVLPVLILIILFFYNFLYGLGALIILIGYLVVTRRTSLYTYIGSLKYSKGNLEECLKWFQKAYATGKAKPQTITSYGYLLLKNGNIDASEEILKKLIESKPGMDDLMYAKSNLALVLWKKGDLDSAVNMLEEIIESYKTTTIYGSLGYLLIMKGDLERALEFNLEAYEYNGSNAIIMDNLGQTYHLKGMNDKALEIYEKCMENKPSFPSAYYNFGSVLIDMNQLEKAKEMLEKASTFKLSYLSTVTSEDIDEKLQEVNLRLNSGDAPHDLEV